MVSAALAEKNIDSLVNEVLNKTYLDKVALLPVIAPSLSLEEAITAIRMSSIHKIVYDKAEDNLQKMSNLFASLSSNNSSIIMILHGNKAETHLYMCVNAYNKQEASGADKVFIGTLQGNFPGVEINKHYAGDIKNITNIMSKAEYVSSSSGIPYLKDTEGNSFVQGVEKIIESMHGKEYVALFIADPISSHALNSIEYAYQSLYSYLAHEEHQQVSLSSSQSIALGESLSKSTSVAIANTLTRSENTAKGTTSSTTVGTTDGTNFLPNPINIFNNLLGPKSTSSSKTESKTYGKTETYTSGESYAQGKTKTTGESTTDSKTYTDQRGISYQYTITNKKVSDCLRNINTQLERIQTCKNVGMWDFGVYFLAHDADVARMGANITHGQLCGVRSGIERSAIHYWSAIEHKANFTKIVASLMRFQHPQFEASSILPASSPYIRATSLISTEELAVGISLPQKSVPGIPVFTSVEFGRTVSCFDDVSLGQHSKQGRTSEDKNDTIKLGVVQHLGKNNSSLPVKLDIASLTAHTFITGSTGAGKSNIIYSLVYNLWKEHKIPFLIVEPAKGEYKDIFGGDKKVHVFGTNPAKTPVLRINPFSFPKNIHIVEHIDRFVEILSAVWPMYSAMPAFLKKAIEQTYEAYGWNLITSENNYGRVFPDFTDLLELLPHLIQQSAYSAEVKGNYIGALITRIESLTNGYFKSVFTKDEHQDSEIFDRPCILDFSRVGSTETKALFMGIIFMRLHEYRIAHAVSSNSNLCHITVLEEAHNLLRKTSVEQSAESTNVQGKSVEMMANAIAEMRTYGEGFIIADQAPSLLDASVIRNTNTKIILRLPDWSDRELVGRAANLQESQIAELARLRTGTAAVYQNNWQEAVLCHCDKFDSTLEKPFLHVQENVSFADNRQQVRIELLKVLFFMLQKQKSYAEALDILSVTSPDLLQQYFPKVIYELSSSTEWSVLYKHINILLKVDIAIQNANTHAIKHKEKSRYTWIYYLLGNIFREIQCDINDSTFCKDVLKYIFSCLTKKHPKDEEFWNAEAEKIDIWLYEMRHAI